MADRKMQGATGARPDRERDVDPAPGGSSGNPHLFRHIQRKGKHGDGDKGDKKDTAEKSFDETYAELPALPPAEQQKRIRGMNASDRQKLAHRVKNDGQKALAKLGFECTPDEEVQALGDFLGARFNLDVGPDQLKGDGGKGLPWEAGGLRRAWQVLEALPPAHVEGNPKIWSLVRYKTKKGAQAEGVYDPEDDDGKELDQAAIGYDPATLDQGDTDFSDENDPLHGANAFNETVRHEVGHAVDAQLGASDSYCTTAAGGGWHDYGGNFEDAALDIVTASGGTIATWHNQDQQMQIISTLGAIMEKQAFDAVEAELKKLPFWANLDKGQQQKILQDPAINAIQKNTNADQPWMGSGGVQLGGRIFQESYDKQWTSYSVEARGRKVSNYQFRAPGEWFAEAYAAYYEPAGSEDQKGKKLGSVDGKTKAYFDATVDKMAPGGDKKKGKEGGGADSNKKKKAS